MLRDAELFRSRLSKLDGAADVGDHIVNVVNGKVVVVAEKATVPESKPVSAEASSADSTTTSEEKPEKKPEQDGEKT